MEIATIVGIVALMGGLVGLARFLNNQNRLQIEGLGTKIDGLKEDVDKRFTAVGKRFDLVDARFDRVDARFDRLEKKLDGEILRLDTKYDRKVDVIRSETLALGMQQREILEAIKAREAAFA